MDIKTICNKLHKANAILSCQTTIEKNHALHCVKLNIEKAKSDILLANQKDVEKAKTSGMKESLIERLSLDEKKIQQIIESLNTIIAIKDPIGEIVSGWTTGGGLKISQVRVPLGVVAIIYESRPNVTVDAFALAYKTGNAILLRGSSSAINSNKALEEAIQTGLKEAGGVTDSLYLVKSTNHSDVDDILNATGLIDVVLPRGGATLIKTVIDKAKIPVIQTGAGVCHLYIDETADLTMALNIACNAKMQRPGACNAIECIVVHKNIASQFLPILNEAFYGKVTIKADSFALKYLPHALLASENDYAYEFLDMIIAIKTVSNIEEAVDFINAHNTKHSDAIITSNLQATQYFKQKIDAACVYVNASTRFTDGGEFGFGAELGISTQKLHARGPMGLAALTCTKYLIEGTGQIR